MSTFKTKNAVFSIIFSLLLLFGLIVWITPTAISTPLGNRAAVKIINRQLDGKAEIRQLSLSWLGPQRISGVLVKDGNQETIASCQQIVIQSSLPFLLFNKLQKAEGTIAGLNVNKPLPAIYDAKGSFTFHANKNLDLSLTGLTGYQSPFDLMLSYTPKANTESGNVAIKLSSSMGNLEGSFVIDESIRLPKEKSTVTFVWKLDPSQTDLTNLLNLQEKKEKLTALSPFTIKGTISQLDIPLNGNILENATLATKLKISQLHLHSKLQDEEIFFKKIFGAVKKEKNSQKLHFSFQSEAGQSETPNGDFLISGSVNKDLSLQMNAKGQKLPIGFLSALSPTKKNLAKQLGAFFGKKVDVDAKISLNNWNGPVQASLLGNNGYFFIDGTVQEGVLFLKKPVELETKVTKELAEDVIHPFFPLFTSMLMSDNTLKATIAPEGFSLPVKNFNLQNINIDSMQINLGLIDFQSQGELAKLLKPFKSRNNQLLTMWFTPIYLNLKNSIVTLKRFDILISNNYPVAVWGTVDTFKEDLNLNIAIATKNFDSALKLSQPYIILPLQGKIGKAQLDTSQLKFSLLTTLAQQFTSSKKTVDKIFGDNSQEILDEEIPSPTTQPFPWENTTAQTEKKNSKEPKKLHLIQQEARSLLKKILTN